MSSSRLVIFLVIAFMAVAAYFIIQWTNSEITSLRAGAASSSSIEAESGVINNATIKQDSLASNGSYAELVPAPLRTLYVSPTGSDTNPGTTSQPLKTFYKAAQIARAGDLVLFKDGTYIETATTKVINSGTSVNPIIFRSQNYQKAVIYFQNMSGKWRMDITGKPYVHIEDFEITGDDNIGSTGSDKFINFTEGSDYGVVRGNKIHHIYEDLVKIYNADYMLVENNELSDVTNEGFDVMNSISPIIRNNTVTNAHRQGFMIKGGVRNAQIYNNTIIQDSGTLYVAMGLGGSSDNIYTYDDSGYEGYHQVAWNNVVVAKNGAIINEGLKMEGCDTCSYFNNIVIGAGLGLVISDGPGKAKGWLVDVHTNNPKFLNNIVMNCSKNALWQYDTPTGTLSYDYNLIYNCPNATIPSQTHGIFSNPLFVNDISDWHLQANSPARGKGSTILPFPTFSDANTPVSSAIDISSNRDNVFRTTPWNIGTY